MESLEEALARWRKENALLSAEIRSLAQPKELDGDMDAKHEGEVDGVAVEEGEGGLVDQLSKVGLVDRGEEEALEAEYSPCAVSTGALDVVGQRAGHCADAPHSVRGGDVQNAPAARPVAFQLDARDITIGRCAPQRPESNLRFVVSAVSRPCLRHKPLCVVQCDSTATAVESTATAVESRL